MTNKTGLIGNFWSTIWIGMLVMLAFVWSPDGYATDNKPESAVNAMAEAAAEAAADAAATSNSGGNSQSIAFSAPKGVPSIYAGSNYPTAPCLATFSIGGSAQGGGGLVSLNLDKKDCKLVNYSQAFAALQQYQIACDLMRAVDGVQEAYREVYKSAVPVCTWPTPEQRIPTVAPADSSVYVRRDELEEKLKRQTETLAGK